MSSSKSKFAKLDQYLLVKNLGSGYTSKVKLAYEKSSNKYFAAKIIRSKVHIGSNIKAIKNEINLLSSLSHPNIVNMVAFKEDGLYTKKNGQSYITKYVILELADAGELFGYIAYGGSFEEKISRYFFQQLISAVDYCHRAGVAHRDLKPENILLDNDFNIKISDFGFSTLTNRNLTSHVGTKLYMAPEMHMSDKSYNGPSVDVFALGFILFTLYTGLQPYESQAHPKDNFYKLFFQNNLEEYWRVVSGYISKEVNLSPEFKTLITSMLSPEACHRPSMTEIKEHPWYKGPSATHEEVFEYLRSRKQKVDEENERQRIAKVLEKKNKEEQLQNSPSKATTTFVRAGVVGNKPYRGINDEKEIERDEDFDKEISKNSEVVLEKEFFLPPPTNLLEFGFCDFFTTESGEKVRELLTELNKEMFTKSKMSASGQKIKCVLVEAEDRLKLIEKIEVRENGVVVFFERRSGPIKRFYEYMKKIKEILGKKLA